MNVWRVVSNENTRDDGYFGTCPVRVPGERLQPPQHDGQHVGMDAGLVPASVRATTSPEIRRGPLGAHTRCRGGSHICHESYCRLPGCGPAREHPDSSTGNLGFRCAQDVGADLEPVFASKGKETWTSEVRLAGFEPATRGLEVLSRGSGASRTHGSVRSFSPDRS